MLEKTKNNNKEKIQRCRSASSSRLIKEFDDFRDEKCALAHLLALSHFSVSIQAQDANESGLKGVCVFGWPSWLMLHLLLLSIILFSLMQIAICLETRNHFSFLLVVEKNFYCILMRSTQTKLLLIKLTFSHRLASCKNDGSLWAILVKFFTIKKSQSTIKLTFTTNQSKMHHLLRG